MLSYIIPLLVELLFASIFIFLFAAVWRGAPYVPTRPSVVTRIIKLAGVKPGEKAVDLGSGDGRLVIALARAGAEARGYEINLWLVLWSRWQIRRAGLGSRAKIIWGSFWWGNLQPYSLVVVYGIPRIMPALEKKLGRELSPDARVVSSAFVFPNWQPKDTDGGLYLYTSSTKPI